MFNDLSENINAMYSLNHEYAVEQRYPYLLGSKPFSDRVFLASLMGAMHRADLLKQSRKKVDSLCYLSVNK